jgi:hypothetical protein
MHKDDKHKALENIEVVVDALVLFGAFLSIAHTKFV